MKPALFHPKVRAILRTFPEEVRRELGKAIFDLQKGAILELPLSKPIPSVGPGVDELRIKDRSGVFRVFYFSRKANAVLIFHEFQKKYSKNPTKGYRIGTEKIRGDAR